MTCSYTLSTKLSTHQSPICSFSPLHPLHISLLMHSKSHMHSCFSWNSLIIVYSHMNKKMETKLSNLAACLGLILCVCLPLCVAYQQQVDLLVQHFSSFLLLVEEDFFHLTLSDSSTFTLDSHTLIHLEALFCMHIHFNNNFSSIKVTFL